MISKELFIKRINLIQNFHSEQDTLGVLIDKITDGYPIVTIGDYLVGEMIAMLTELLELDDNDLLEWWLYENADKVIYIDHGEEKEEEVTVRTLDELYDYIVEDL